MKVFLVVTSAALASAVSWPSASRYLNSAPSWSGGKSSWHRSSQYASPLLPSNNLGAMGMLEAASGAGGVNFQHAPVLNEMTHVAVQDGPMHENTKKSTQVQTKTTVTHHPVFYKTYLDHYTQHDTKLEDVYHHIGEEEMRYFDVEGRTVGGSKSDIDHGKIGHASYGSVVGAYTSMTGRNLLGRSYMSPQWAARRAVTSFRQAPQWRRQASRSIKRHTPQFRRQAIVDNFGAMGVLQAASGGGSNFAARNVQNEVEHVVMNDGPMIENTKDNTQVQTKTVVTHHPVFYKTYLDHYTQHDTKLDDVYHHIGEEEMRYFDVEGKTLSGSKQNIDHGKVGHAAYGSIVGAYGAN